MASRKTGLRAKAHGFELKLKPSRRSSGLIQTLIPVDAWRKSTSTVPAIPVKDSPRDKTPREEAYPVPEVNFDSEDIRDDFFDVVLTERDFGRKTKSSHDYMREWLEFRKPFLQEVIARESPPPSSECSRCHEKTFKLRCKDCLYRPTFCVQCCRKEHQHHPYHRIEEWTGTHFIPAWLWQTGVSIHLGHAGNCCPSNEQVIRDSEAVIDRAQDLIRPVQLFNYLQTVDFPEPDDTSEEHEYGASRSGRPPVGTFKGASVVVVVHTNAVHYLPVYLCQCPEAPEPLNQYLRMGFYPSTFQRIETVFTFQVLDDYLLENLECQTSCHHYYSKLRRMTDRVFPKRVPDRKRELSRAERQWRNIKEWKWHGFGHRDADPGEGELALFCPTCPQPGVNLPKDWEEDEAQWKFQRSFVADGNFVAVHQQQPRTTDDVWIKNGQGYMTETTRYQRHLDGTVEVPEPSTCNEHRAVLDRAKPHKGCDVSGIGAFACLRHGCYCPTSIVNFQKGEKQMNMDYGFCQAIHHTGTHKAPRICLIYDINCQYNRHLRRRVEEGTYLSFRPGLNLVAGIGMFHVHGHQDVCYARFAPRFIPGIGTPDGETLERLFSILNGVSTIARTMTLAHRSETLDSHMGDNNFKKMIDMVPSICKKWQDNCKDAEDSKVDYKMLSETAHQEQLRQWQAMADKAQRDRLNGNVEAMDIYNVKYKRVIPQAEIRAGLMQVEQELHVGVGETSWIVDGMKIQEAQSELIVFIRTQGRSPTAEQQIEINKKREVLHQKIEEFHNSFFRLFPLLRSQTNDVIPRDIPYGEDVLADDEAEDEIYEIPRGDVETIRLILPSTSPPNLSPTLQHASEVERSLRISQAEHALEGVRREIGHKSFLFRNNIRLSENKTMKTRGYAAVKAADVELKKHVRIYNQARDALQNLGASPEVLSRYQILKKEELVALKTVYDPNARGQSNMTLAWFWTMNVGAESESSDYMEELYRVNWLRAHAKYTRWREETILLLSEMTWTSLFFAHRSQQWETLAEVDERAGHKAYASKQAAMWKELEKNAKASFQSCLIRCPPPPAGTST